MSTVDGVLIDMSIYQFHMGPDDTYCVTMQPNPALCAPKSKLLPRDTKAEARGCILLALAEASIKYTKDWTKVHGNAIMPATTMQQAATEMFRQLAGPMKTWQVCEPWTDQDILAIIPNMSKTDLANMETAQKAGACHPLTKQTWFWFLAGAVILMLIVFMVMKSRNPY